jgi:anionic cell wall polymer biosynthesis LytR-Cps2A-Psr (LCP) family protein
MHDLQGTAALQFLRTRHGLASGSDLARIGNQQAFLASLVRTIKSEGTLSDPLKLYSLAKAAADNMVLSTSLQAPGTMVAIAATLRDIDLSRVTFVQYPVAGTDSGIEPLKDDAAALFDALANDQPIALSGTVGEATKVEPSDAPTGTATPPESAAPWSSDAASAAPTIGPGNGPVQLPPSIPGQTANEETCTVGQSAGG